MNQTAKDYVFVVHKTRAPRVHKACTNCRARKIRCKPMENNPKSCQRCTRKSLECRYLSVAEHASISSEISSDSFPATSVETDSPNFSQPLIDPQRMANAHFTQQDLSNQLFHDASSMYKDHATMYNSPCITGPQFHSPSNLAPSLISDINTYTEHATGQYYSFMHGQHMPAHPQIYQQLSPLTAPPTPSRHLSYGLGNGLNYHSHTMSLSEPRQSHHLPASRLHSATFNSAQMGGVDAPIRSKQFSDVDSFTTLPYTTHFNR